MRNVDGVDFFMKLQSIVLHCFVGLFKIKSVSYEEMIGKSSNQGVQHFSFFAAEIEKKPIFLMQNIRK